MMPEPRPEVARWASELTNWNAGYGGDQAPNYLNYPGIDPVADDDMIQRILLALFSEKGKKRYQKKLKPKNTAPAAIAPTPTPMAPGVTNAGGGFGQSAEDEYNRLVGGN